jgi:hypothetical protein
MAGRAAAMENQFFHFEVIKERENYRSDVV